MTRARGYESRSSQKRIYKPVHDKPRGPWLDYILLPYGLYYEKTLVFLDAKSGDRMQFSDGPEVAIDSVTIVEDERMCDILCRMRYGVRFKVAFAQWMKYARIEGHGRDIISPTKCIMVVYGEKAESNKGAKR